MSGNKSKRSESKMYFKLVVQGIFSLLLIIVLMFILAGRITYWQGWVFSGIAIFGVLVQSLLFAGKTELVKERMKPGPGTKWWDKVFFAAYIPMFFAGVIVAIIDAGRFGWTSYLPLSVYIPGCIAFVLSLFIYSWAMWINSFFSSAVRIQTDRGQKVVQDGPYRFIRHPGYVAGILMAISVSLVLGSLWALIPAGVVVILLIIRTYLEDTTLQQELIGYADYTKKVKYRLFPGIW